MKKLILILIVIASIVCLSGCGGYATEADEKEKIMSDTVTYSLREPLPLVETTEMPELFSVEESAEPVMMMLSEEPAEMKIAVKDESLQVNKPDTISAAELEKRRLEQEHENLLELKAKKEDGERLKAKEEIKLNQYEYNVRKQSVEKSMDRLEDQNAKLDSLLKEKEKK